MKKSSRLSISRILHAGYVFEYQGVHIAFDPIFENPFSRNCHAFPDVEFDQSQMRNLKFSAVFISHYHDDHCSLESLNLLDRQTPIYIYCVFPELFSMLEELGFESVHSLAIDSSTQIGDFTITPRQALDADVDSLLQIQAGGMNVLNVVDSWIGPQILKQLVSLAPWDLILWPFQTMREVEVLSPNRVSWEALELPPEWIPQLQALDPKYIVPSSCQFLQESWSWYNQALFPITYAHFQNWVQAILPTAKVVRMNPSTSFLLSAQGLKAAQALSWVVPKGEQNVDYQPRFNFQAPSTANIAQNFRPLSETQTAKVLVYCREGILKIYQSLGESTEPYFYKSRSWRLSLYDHHGQAVHFYYTLKNENIVLADSCQEEKLSWSTELPLAKLWAALEQGESLSSMYVRINGQLFSSEIEKELRSVDLLEDPLLRCLSSGGALAYQRAQLQRIRGKAGRIGVNINGRAGK
jgi:hypothetical protein